MKLGVVTMPTNRKNRLTFDGDTVPGADSGSLFQGVFVLGE